jgi:hypothetical protein
MATSPPPVDAAAARRAHLARKWLFDFDPRSTGECDFLFRPPMWPPAGELSRRPGAAPPPSTPLARDGGQLFELRSDGPELRRLFAHAEHPNPRLIRRHAAEAARQAARAAAGPHGFAALRPGGAAAPPELQQLLAFSLQEALDFIACNGAPLDLKKLADANAAGLVPDLLLHLPPHLTICLVAEVAAGLLCPG